MHVEGDDVNASKELLREVVAKAARDPAAHPDLTLTYQRGHELSGMTRFGLRADGHYTLTSDDPRRQHGVALEGELEPAQRDTILTAIDEARLLDVPSSSRNIGDDEQPIVVELRHDGAEHRLVIWAGDARSDPGFAHFETVLRGVMRQISDGEVPRGV
jgi:hypothetical protein